MIRKSAFRRIAIASLALCILLISYFFPEANQTESHYQSEINYQNYQTTPLYLTHENGFVARVSLSLTKETETINQAKERIELLTIQGKMQDYIPEKFYAVIPAKTKLLSVDTQDNVLKLNFSKDILAIPSEKEVSMLEAITYTLTELESIDGVMIFVEGEIITKKLNASNLPTVFSRDFGINKNYHLTDIKNTTKTTAYYVAKQNQLEYYVPITYVSNQKEENKIEIIIEKLKSAPIHETNLMTYLHASAELLDYQILEDAIHLSFNQSFVQDIYEDKILEEVKYAISQSIKDSVGNYNIKFFVDEKEI